MKKKLIFLFIMVGLFIIGLLIYDFSDIMDSTLMDNKWYLYENDITYVMDFNDNKFEFTLEDGTRLNKYSKCNTYKYNNSTNVVKLNCDVDGNKIYIAKYDNDSLTLTMDGIEKILFSSKELALINDFKKNNDLTDEEYDSLISLKFDENKYITIEELSKLYKDKKTIYVGLVRNDISYLNALNYKALSKIINKNYYLINLDLLDKDMLKKLNKKTSMDKYDKNKIYVFELGKKKMKLKKEIDIKNIREISSFKL